MWLSRERRLVPESRRGKPGRKEAVSNEMNGRKGKGTPLGRLLRDPPGWSKRGIEAVQWWLPEVSGSPPPLAAIN